MQIRWTFRSSWSLPLASCRSFIDYFSVVSLIDLGRHYFHCSSHSTSSLMKGAIHLHIIISAQACASPRGFDCNYIRLRLHQCVADWMMFWRHQRHFVVKLIGLFSCFFCLVWWRAKGTGGSNSNYRWSWILNNFRHLWPLVAAFVKCVEFDDLALGQSS